jgi:hypothetical protein
MKWTVSLPRVVAEDDRLSVEVEADSIEEAITKAAVGLHGHDEPRPRVGQTYLVSARVEVVKRSALPLRPV